MAFSFHKDRMISIRKTNKQKQHKVADIAYFRLETFKRRTELFQHLSRSVARRIFVFLNQYYEQEAIESELLHYNFRLNRQDSKYIDLQRLCLTAYFHFTMVCLKEKAL